jgi:hypothetical protein
VIFQCFALFYLFVYFQPYQQLCTQVLEPLRR